MWCRPGLPQNSCCQASRIRYEQRRSKDTLTASEQDILLSPSRDSTPRESINGAIPPLERTTGLSFTKRHSNAHPASASTGVPAAPNGGLSQGLGSERRGSLASFRLRNPACSASLRFVLRDLYSVSHFGPVRSPSTRHLGSTRTWISTISSIRIGTTLFSTRIA